MLTYHLNDYNEKPLYNVLYKCIRNDIINGNINPGDKLPSKRALASHLKISVTTVENAYDMLLQEGYIYSKPSSGFFATDMVWPDHLTSPSPTKEENTEIEDDYKMDFHGNMAGLKLFPISIWTKLMRQILSESNLSLLQTIPWNGLYSLRYAISDYLRRYKGIHVSPNLIIIGAGTEYLYSRLLQLFSYKSVIAFEDPGYVKLARIADNSGVLTQFIPVDEDGLSVKALRLSNATAVHVSPANHFPTGIVMSEERRRELLAWVAEDPYRYIIEDDYDSEFSYNSDNLKPLFSRDKNNQVIYMNTFSKSLVPSLRISYMILPNSLQTLYRKSQEFYSCTVSSFEQMTLSNFISEGYFERHIDRLKNYYMKKRDILLKAISESPLKNIARPKDLLAGTHLMIQIKTTMSDNDIKKKIEQLNIHLPMLSDYCHTPKIDDLHTVILNFAGMEESDIGKSIKILENLFIEDKKN